MSHVSLPTVGIMTFIKALIFDGLTALGFKAIRQL